MKKFALKMAAAAILTSSLTGCIGQMGLSQKLLDINLQIVDNKFLRAGIFIIASPIYSLSMTGDLFIVNTIEFWTGTNPLTNKPALADQSKDAIININSNLNKDIIKHEVEVESANVLQIDENTLEMSVAYADGTTKILRGEKQDGQVHFYIDGEFVTTASVEELKAYTEDRI